MSNIEKANKLLPEQVIHQQALDKIRKFDILKRYDYNNVMMVVCDKVKSALDALNIDEPSISMIKSV